MPPITQFPHLEEIVSRLAQGLQAEQIYLFGSQAAKKDASGRDVDLLVVAPSQLPRHQREAHASYQFILAKLPDRIANSPYDQEPQ